MVCQIALPWIGLCGKAVNRSRMPACAGMADNLEFKVSSMNQKRENP